MTNDSIDSAFSTNEAISIDLKNYIKNTSFPKVLVYTTNTMGQILDEYADDIGVDISKDKIVFTNMRTHAATSDKDETVSGLGLQDGDTLAITDDGRVA